MDNYIESSRKNKKGHIDILFYGLVITLLAVIICIIVYNDYFQDDINNPDNNSSSINLINGYWGDYNIYLTEVDDESLENEYMLILYEPDGAEDNQGFFQITSASSMEYNNVISGYYEINDKKIIFSQNLTSEEEKNNFALYLGVSVSDLYQNEDEVSDGYNYLYNVDLTYSNNNISSSTFTFKQAS